MKKMTLSMAAILFLGACGTAEQATETTETTGTATKSATEQQIASNATNGDDSISGDDSSEQDSASQGTSEVEDTASPSNGETTTIREFDLDLEFGNDRDWDFDYDEDGEARIERDGSENLSGEAARDEFTRLFQSVQFTTDRPLEEIKREVLEVVGAQASDVRDFELDVKFETNEEIEIDHDARNANNSTEVDEFSLDLEFVGGGEASYEYESDEREAEIERRNGSEIEDGQAVEEMERLLGQISITMDRSIDDMKAEVLEALSIDPAEVEDFDLEISYRGGEEIKFAHDLK
ncbi:YusW family protein [Planococcus dechangensis]|uniref:YusW family protein n=1 Tax=Planococcus dechangensis TaxID=1176255 RepID=A0ABV9MIF4_9BACL